MSRIITIMTQIDRVCSDHGPHGDKSTDISSCTEQKKVTNFTEVTKAIYNKRLYVLLLSFVELIEF